MKYHLNSHYHHLVVILSDDDNYNCNTTHVFNQADYHNLMKSIILKLKNKNEKIKISDFKGVEFETNKIINIKNNKGNIINLSTVFKKLIDQSCNFFEEQRINFDGILNILEVVFNEKIFEKNLFITLRIAIFF